MVQWKAPIDLGPVDSASGFGRFEVNALSNNGYVAARIIGGNLALNAFDHLGNGAWSKTLNFTVDLTGIGGPNGDSGPKVVAHSGTFTVITTQTDGLTRFLTYDNDGTQLRTVAADISFDDIHDPNGLSPNPIFAHGALDGGIFLLWVESTETIDGDRLFSIAFASVDGAGEVHEGTIDSTGIVINTPMSITGVDILDDGHLVVHYMTTGIFFDDDGEEFGLAEIDANGNRIERLTGEAPPTRTSTTPTVNELSTTFADGRELSSSVNAGQLFVGIEDNRGFQVVGTEGKDILTARHESTVVKGLGGNDLIIGLEGFDDLSGGDGNDTLEGGDGRDRIAGDSGNDTVRAGEGDDTIVFRDVADVAGFTNITDGGGGRDFLEFEGASSASTYDLTNLSKFQAVGIEGITFSSQGGSGSTTIQLTNTRFANGDFSPFFDVVGRSGSVDRLQINITTGTSFDASGFDFSSWFANDAFTIVGSVGNDTVKASAFADFLRGGSGDDTLIGDIRDEMRGEGGNDTIVVRSGGFAPPSGKLLDGGDDTDTLKIENVLPSDTTLNLRSQTVTGFEKIQLSGVAANNGAEFAYAQLAGKAIVIDFVSTVPQTAETLTIFVEGIVSTNLSQLTFQNVQAADRIVLRGDAAFQTFNGLSTNESVFAGGGADAIRSSAGRDELFGEAGDDFLIVGEASHIVAGEVYDGGEDFDVLEVTGSGGFDFRPAKIVSIEQFQFSGALSTLVNLSSNQIGNGGLAANATIAGDFGGKANLVDITLSPLSNTLDISGWSFLDWEANDRVEIFGSIGSDSIIGSSASDLIFGGGGDDELDGRNGADGYLGGEGDDTYFFDGTDSITEFTDQGNDLVVATTNVSALMDNVEEVTLKAGSAAALNADGNGLDNRMRGNEFENVLKGLAGDDMLSGGDGKDTMIGGDGDDMIFVDQADDIVVELVNGGTADWVIASRSFDLIAGVEVELLSTIDDRDTAKINLYGNEVAQTITGNAGANILSDGGKGGADILIGLNGDDTYRVYNKGTKIIEGPAAGSDTVQAAVSYTVGKGVYIQVLETTNVKGTADLALYSNEFGQTVVGNAGANSLRGYGGNDTLSGGAGDDRISGGRGNDTLAGNSGADTYYFSYALNASTNVDTIKGFSSIDLISLSSAIFTKAGSVGALAASAFSANTTGLADDASDRIIWETDTGILRYDPDGTGSAEATAFAIITGNTGAINAGDFVIA